MCRAIELNLYANAMRLPVLQGVIDRRLLVNYRVDPAAIERILPPPFRPKLHRGFAIAGICLIRLKQIRPKFMPLRVGIGSENAAHRIAVEWDDGGVTHEGVFIPRRDTNSRFNACVGGRLFPGEHHHAKFVVQEKADQMFVSIASDDRQMHVAVRGHVAEQLPINSVFESLAEASQFFQAGSLGYSVTADAGRYDGLEMDCKSWKVEPFEVQCVESSFFDDMNQFPPGAVIFDSALVMRGIEHEWHGRDDLCCAVAATS
jgi:hypothetical protein